MTGMLTDPRFPWLEPASVSPEVIQQTRDYIRRTAWTQALSLFDEWSRTLPTPGGAGWTNPARTARHAAARTELDVLIAEHGFEGTYVDPIGLSWMQRRAASTEYPEVAA